MDEFKKTVRQKYKEFVVEGIQAINILQAKGYTQEAVTAMLMANPLRTWFKTADRALYHTYSYDRKYNNKSFNTTPDMDIYVEEYIDNDPRRLEIRGMKTKLEDTISQKENLYLESIKKKIDFDTIEKKK
ncbi:MAG: hypothetical protein KBB88_01540 [Candidatus Pacebacteria bacterium]|nr:hypothetical protein [Candidatus Paceibacterota bacterium]